MPKRPAKNSSSDFFDVLFLTRDFQTNDGIFRTQQRDGFQKITMALHWIQPRHNADDRRFGQGRRLKDVLCPRLDKSSPRDRPARFQRTDKILDGYSRRRRSRAPCVDKEIHCLANGARRARPNACVRQLFFAQAAAITASECVAPVCALITWMLCSAKKERSAGRLFHVAYGTGCKPIRSALAQGFCP